MDNLRPPELIKKQIIDTESLVSSKSRLLTDYPDDFVLQTSLIQYLKIWFNLRQEYRLSSELERIPDLIIDEIRDLNRLIITIKNVYKKSPEDFLLKLLEEEYSNLNTLKIELKEASQKHRSHLLEYAFDNVINLKVMSDCLSNINEVIYDTIRHLWQKVDIQFNFQLVGVLTGSFSALLSTCPEEDMFDNLYSESFDFFFDTINELNNHPDDTNKIAIYIKEKFRNNTDLVSKYQKLFENIKNSKKSVTFKWNNLEMKPRNVRVENQKASILSYLLKKRPEIKEEEIELLGTIKAIDLLDSKLGFIQEAIKDFPKKIKGIKFTADLVDDIKEHFDTPCTCLFEKTTKYNEVTGGEKIYWKLLHIMTPIKK